MKISRSRIYVDPLIHRPVFCSALQSLDSMTTSTHHPQGSMNRLSCIVVDCVAMHAVSGPSENYTSDVLVSPAFCSVMSSFTKL
jgi:hypothetical protein